MARNLRCVPKDALVEITTRTLQSRMLLRPSEATNAAILSVLGRALHLYPVKLHAFVVMSNHMHLLVSPGSAERLAAFMKFVNGNISSRVGKLVDWPGRLWARRYQSINVYDDPAQVDRLRYCLEHGCKEGLVAHPEEWPGLSSAESLRTGKPLVGRWLDTRRLYQARRRKNGPPVCEDAFATDYTIELAPLPCWAGLREDARRAAVSVMIDEVVASTAILNANVGRRVVGRTAICAMDPRHRPDQTKRSPAPRVHASTAASRADFKQLYRDFVGAYYRGLEGLRTGAREVRMPEGCFLPPCLPLAAFRRADSFASSAPTTSSSACSAMCP